MNEKKLSEMDLCTLCIRPKSHKDIHFNKYGVCNYCTNYQKKWIPYLKDDETRSRIHNKIERILEKELNKRKKYHALIGLSGGKDSIFALYLCRTKFNLNVLTYTMNSPFLATHAKKNIELAKKVFNVDHVWTQGPSIEMFRHFLMKTGKVCYPCNLSIMLPIRKLSQKNDIKLVISGGSRLRDGLDPEGVTQWFFRNVIRQSNNPELRREGKSWYRESVRTMVSVMFGRPQLILLGSYFDGSEEERSRMLEERYGFILGHEHSDCELHDLASYCAMLKYGFSLKLSKYSKAIVAGSMDRNDALIRIEEENAYLKTFPKSIVEAIERLGVVKEQVRAMGTDQYYTGIMNRIVAWYRRKYYL